MTDQLQLPGLIDCHVHFREPGLEHKATMASESLAAKAGGVYTVCDMPNTSPPPQTVEIFAQKAAIAAAIPDVDIRLFFGATKQEHLAQLSELWLKPEHDKLKQRCCGLKLFLENSTGNLKVEEGVTEAAFHLCGKLDIPLVAHCEDPEMNAAAFLQHPGNELMLHSLRRPPESEAASIAKAVELVKQFGTPFHVAHLSTADGLEVVREAKAAGLPVTCEVTPHHLFLSTEDYEELGARAKMNPPVREPSHQGPLWDGLIDGTIDCVGTDHAPHLLVEKEEVAPLEAPSGVPGVETMLPLLLTVAAGRWPHPTRKQSVTGFTYDHIRRACFDNPNQIYRLEAPSESRLTIDPGFEWIIEGDKLHSQCGWTPYEGWHVVGKIISDS